MRRGAPPVPVAFIALNAIAMVFLSAGIIGLSFPELVPPLAAPRVAWALIAVGIVLDAAAIGNLVCTLKNRARARTTAPG